VDSIAYYQGEGGRRRNNGEDDIQFPIISMMDRCVQAIPGKCGKLPFQVF
jgi:hypothetical protein